MSFTRNLRDHLLLWKKGARTKSGSLILPFFHFLLMLGLAKRGSEDRLSVHDPGLRGHAHGRAVRKAHL